MGAKLVPERNKRKRKKRKKENKNGVLFLHPGSIYATPP
jgi:hypothetical protein